MKCNAFIKSLKVQAHNFRSEVVQTSNEFSLLELRYKELQKNLVPIFRSLSQEKDVIAITERKKRREDDRMRISSRLESQRNVLPNSDIQNRQIRPKNGIVYTREFNLNEMDKDANNNQDFSAEQWNRNDRRRIIPAPCHVMTFEKEKFSPFNARTSSTQIRIRRSFPPPKGIAEAAEKRRAMKNAKEAKTNVKLPRVAFLSVTNPA